MRDELEKMRFETWSPDLKVMAFLVDQSRLTADCFLIQIRGLVACSNCEFRNTEDCGGVEIQKKIAAGTFPVRGIGEPIK